MMNTDDAPQVVSPTEGATATPTPEAPQQQPQQPQYRGGGGGGGGGRHSGGGGRGGPGGGPGGRRPRSRVDAEGEDSGLQENVVKVFRCSRVVKGGRKFSYGALVVVGDRQGNVGLGYGKANEVPQAVDKGIKEAKRNLKPISLKGGTIPHPIVGRCGASSVKLIPASPGTGVGAAGAVRAVLELAGVTDILTKASGSTNPKNMCKAVLTALVSVRSREQVEQLRGVSLKGYARA